MAAARATIEESSWQDAWAEGEAMSVEEAVPHALAEQVIRLVET